MVLILGEIGVVVIEKAFAFFDFNTGEIMEHRPFASKISPNFQTTSSL